MKKEEEKKRVPLSLEELIAKKKAEEEAESKVCLQTKGILAAKSCAFLGDYFQRAPSPFVKLYRVSLWILCIFHFVLG